MPTYTYRCKACAHQFDQFQKFSDDPLTVCPECGAEIQRVIQPVGVVFKGSGWYITDSRKPAESEASSHSSGDKNGTKEKDGKGKASNGDAKTSTKSEASKTAAT
ncbi:MAG TPA: FmdB family zinc ribbon protein [Thermomicrobiales bacterium]|jgi:putative FmdB family regulatory protein|nr:FmdB family zinc ribbon protein [Thermomicrobiales bacterium]